jgi:hypothetical protein
LDVVAKKMGDFSGRELSSLAAPVLVLVLHAWITSPLLFPLS